ncbi:MAG TPA: hypothetical protein VMW73_14975 [Spirochaetia bacterium]|nr:hypothetical protein [Spirochaetia bacterium]
MLRQVTPGARHAGESAIVLCLDTVELSHKAKAILGNPERTRLYYVDGSLLLSDSLWFVFDVTRILSLCGLTIALLLLGGCATAPVAGPRLPPLDVSELARQGTPLSVALVATEQVQDVHSRIFAYTEIAKAYLAHGDLTSADNLLQRILTLLDIENLTQDRADIESVVAGIYVKGGQTARATGLLQDALARSANIRDDANRAIVLQKIIAACFDAGPSAYDLLRQTIQQVYIIQDLWVRTSVLIDTARRYEEAGTPQSVDVLLQQAIPAAGSIESPWLKALALSDIAVRFSVLGNNDSARYFAGRAFDQITSVTVVRRSEADAARLLQVAQNLTRLGDVGNSIRVLQTVRYPYLRAEGLAEVSAILHAENPGANRKQALDLCSQAVDLAQSVQDPYRRALALARIAGIYGAIGQPRLALATSEVARESVGQISDSSQHAAAVQAVAQVDLTWASSDRAFSLVAGIQDAYSRTETMIRLANYLIEQKDLDAARRAVDIAEADAARGTYLVDNLYRGIALVRIGLGEFDQALTDIARLKEPSAVAIVLADLGMAAKSGSVDTPAATRTLHAIASAMLGNSPSAAGSAPQEVPPSGATESTPPAATQGGQGL